MSSSSSSSTAKEQPTKQEKRTGASIAIVLALLVITLCAVILRAIFRKAGDMEIDPFAGIIGFLILVATLILALYVIVVSSITLNANKN